MISNRFNPLGISLLCLAFVAGCGGEQKGGPREETYPITAIVMVDGQPESQIQVQCHPEGASKLTTNSAAYTDEQGRFAIGTYESGDGAPVGDYKLTFVWGQINLLSGRYETNGDKFNGRYADVEKSTFSASVKPGEECDLGVITLTTE